MRTDNNNLPQHAEWLCLRLTAKKKLLVPGVKNGKSIFSALSEVGGLSRLGLARLSSGGPLRPALFVCTAGSNVTSCSPGDRPGMWLNVSSGLIKNDSLLSLQSKKTLNHQHRDYSCQTSQHCCTTSITWDIPGESFRVARLQILFRINIKDTIHTSL